MYLAEINISNFRKFPKLKVNFGPGLNVLVGENNIGKTAIIDGLRALLAVAEDGPLRLYEDDVNRHSENNIIEFHYIFSGLSLEEEAAFIEALVPVEGGDEKYNAHFHIRYERPEHGGRLRPKRWCGIHEENGLNSTMLEHLRAVYLPPLRDPMQGLRPGRASQVARLSNILTSDADKEKLESLVKELDSTLKTEKPVENTQRAITNRLDSIVGKEHSQSILLDLAPPDFKKIISRLSLTVDELDVEQNGLGYNNILYTAAVLSELEHSEEPIYRGLLIEEPEAHLHPQLQSVLLRYLVEEIKSNTEKEGAEKENSEPEVNNVKNVQVIVSSHSPTFASQAPVDSIVSLHLAKNEISAIRTASISFKKGKKEKLERFLDVTRAELFFAKKVLFVEGIAEALLIPKLANLLKVDLRRQSVSVINTAGLNFDCFLPLFGDGKINIPVAVLTDSDPKKDCFPEKVGAVDESDQLKSLRADFESDSTRIFASQKTFEYDLALQSQDNIVLMLNALEKMHPQIAKSLKADADKGTNNVEKAKALYEGMFQRENANVAKGEYAQELASLLGVECNFKVPEYISDAITYLVK